MASDDNSKHPKISRVWWVFPGDEQLPMSVIDAPPQVWQDKVTGDRVRPEFYKRFVKVAEIISNPLDLPCD